MTLARLLLASILSAAAATPFAHASAPDDVVAASVVRTDTPTDATLAEEVAYAVRESTAAELRDFAGGHNGASLGGIGVAAVVVLALVLVLIVI